MDQFSPLQQPPDHAQMQARVEEAICESTVCRPLVSFLADCLTSDAMLSRLDEAREIVEDRLYCGPVCEEMLGESGRRASVRRDAG